MRTMAPCALLSLLFVIVGCPSAGPADPTPEPAAAPTPETPPQPVSTPVAEAEPAAEATAMDAYGAALSARRRGDLVDAARQFARACEAGHSQGCYRWALALRDGEGVAADGRRAAEVLAQTCAQGLSRACDAMGH